MSQFLFQGDYKRRPTQTLGGNSRAVQQKSAVIQQAEILRKQRERERNELVALKKLQAFFRGCLERNQIRKRLSQEFDLKKKEMGTNETAFLFQVYRLNVFYRHGDEGCQERLRELGKILLSKYSLVIDTMKSDSTCAFAMKRIIQKCFRCLHSRISTQTAIFLRLIDTFTDPRNYMQQDDDGSDSDAQVAITLLASIWIFLVEHADLFVAYRHFLEAKIPPMKSETETNRITQTYDYLLVYKRILGLKTILEGQQLQISGKSKTYGVEEAIALINFRFVKSFTSQVIPLEDNNGIAAYFILPRLSDCATWQDWASTVDNLLTSGQSPTELRHALYATLIFMRNIELTKEADVDYFINTLHKFRPAVDPRFGPVSLKYGISSHLREIKEEMEIDEDDEVVPGITGASYRPHSTYLQECHEVYKMLTTVFNRPEVERWLASFSPVRWKPFSEIVCCIARMEPTLSLVDFMCLSMLSLRKEFMKPLCLHIINNEGNLKDDEILAFCWFFKRLILDVHDAEFFSGIHIGEKSLEKLLLIVKDIFTGQIIRNSGSTPVDPYSFAAVTDILMQLHDRNTRLQIFTEEVFTSTTLTNICPTELHSFRFEHLTSEIPLNDLSPMEEKLLKILREFPFILPFPDRVKVWNRLLDLDKQSGDMFPTGGRGEVQIRRNFIYEDAFEKLSPGNVPDLRRQLRISLVNVVGAMEAGIDGGGLLREFLTEATKAAVDPNRGLFRVDSDNRIYPNPIARVLFPNFRDHFFTIGRLVGKSLYEQTLLELPFAAFFIQYCIEGKVSSTVDFLATLDPALHKNLLALKTYRGDLTSLGLDFTLNIEELGETRTVELKPNGRDIVVDHSNLIEYIQRVADYKINKEMELECRCFRHGLLDVVPSVKMFSWMELQTLISGSDRPIDLDDWRKNTNYGPEFNDNHPTVQMFWEVVKGFDENYLRMLLKFVTSCSRPPLLGFKDLNPKFGIQNAGQTDRLPTASTCMNLLKLPEFNEIDIMREKLLYVINAQAGFELS